MSMTEKDKAYKDVVANINKEFGEGSVLELGNRVGKVHPCVPTGIYQVDYGVLGIGGLPRGRITEVYGAPSGGKTTTALTVIANAQRAGGRCAYVDAEHALDPNWMKTLGVDVDNLLVSQPDHGEQALSITQSLIESNVFTVIVVDSVAALVPKAELDGEIGSSFMGLQARMMGQAMRKFTGAVHKSNAAIIFINQVRDKIGVTFGNPETTTGGKALSFYASVRLDVRRIASVKNGDVIVGNRTKFKAVKNKMSAPFREAEVDLLFSSGFDGDLSFINAAIDLGVVVKNGSWYSYKDTKLGQGIESVRKLILDPSSKNEVLKTMQGINVKA